MTRKEPNYIWRKSASAAWIEKNAEQLNEKTGARYALIERPGRSRITVESFCPSVRTTRDLAKIFGGSVVRLRADWVARSFESHKTKPLRIGNRLTVQSDPDPAAGAAVLAGLANARCRHWLGNSRNRVSGVKFITGDVRPYLTGTFDLITANLYSDLLEALLPSLGKCLAQAGVLILSGVLRSQEPQLTRALKANGIRILEARRRGKWIALVADRRPKT